MLAIEKIVIGIGILMLLGFLYFLVQFFRNRNKPEYISSLPPELERRVNMNASAIKSRGKFYVMGFVFSIMLLSMTKLGEWLWDLKRVLIALGLMIVAVFVMAYYELTTNYGSIAIDISKLSNEMPFQRIADASIFLKFTDKLGNTINDVEFSEENSDKEPEVGLIELKSNDEGLAYVNYSGRIDDKVIVSVEIKPNSDTLFVAQHLDTIDVTKNIHQESVKLKSKAIGKIKMNLSLDGEALVKNKIVKKSDVLPTKFKLSVSVLKDDEYVKGKFYLKTSANEKGELLERVGLGKYQIEAEFSETPYYLKYIIQNRSIIKTNIEILNNDQEVALIVKEDFAEQEFKINDSKKKKKPKNFSLGGDMIDEKPKNENIQYTFEIYDYNEDELILFTPTVVIENLGDLDFDGEFLVEKGKFTFPAQPVPSRSKFWRELFPDGIKFKLIHEGEGETNTITFKRPDKGEEEKTWLIFWDDDDNSLLKEIMEKK